MKDTLERGCYFRNEYAGTYRRQAFLSVYKLNETFHKKLQVHDNRLLTYEFSLKFLLQQFYSRLI